MGSMLCLSDTTGTAHGQGKRAPGLSQGCGTIFKTCYRTVKKEVTPIRNFSPPPNGEESDKRSSSVIEACARFAFDTEQAKSTMFDTIVSGTTNAI